MGGVVAVRISEPIRSALEQAAKADFTTPAALARQAIVADLRRRGRLPDPNAGEQA